MTRTQFEADLANRVQTLFARCPALCGFSVEGGGAQVLDLTCYPAPDAERMEVILGEVSGLLSELAEEEPRAVELLRGRTFARSVH